MPSSRQPRTVDLHRAAGVPAEAGPRNRASSNCAPDAHPRVIGRQDDQPVAQLEERFQDQAFRQARLVAQRLAQFVLLERNGLDAADRAARLPGEDAIDHAELHQMPPSTRMAWPLM